MHISDWSSDVCSSDLPEAEVAARVPALFKCNVELLVADASLRLERIVEAEITRWHVVAVGRIARRGTGHRQLAAERRVPAKVVDARQYKPVLGHAGGHVEAVRQAGTRTEELTVGKGCGSTGRSRWSQSQ